MGNCCCKEKPPKQLEESSGYGMLIIIAVVCVCCVMLAISSSIAAYFLMADDPEPPFDKTLLEYRTRKDSKRVSTIIKTLPYEVKDAYYINMPVQTGKRYRFTGKACLDGVCDDVNLRNVEAIHLYYEDGNLLNGKLEYNT